MRNSLGFSSLIKGVFFDLRKIIVQYLTVYIETKMAKRNYIFFL